MAIRTHEPAQAEHQGHAQPAPGTYRIDPAHSSVEFVSRHLMISKVRGRFADVSGEVHIGDAPEHSRVEATVRTASISTGDETRDAHLRGADFFDVERYPEVTFRSTGVEVAADGSGRITGDLTLRGVTRPVALGVEFDGGSTDPWGNYRIAFTATGEVDREEWGLTWNVPLETGGVLVGRKVRVELHVQATRQS